MALYIKHLRLDKDLNRSSYTVCRVRTRISMDGLPFICLFLLYAYEGVNMQKFIMIIRCNVIYPVVYRPLGLYLIAY